MNRHTENIYLGTKFNIFVPFCLLLTLLLSVVFGSAKEAHEVFCHVQQTIAEPFDSQKPSQDLDFILSNDSFGGNYPVSDCAECVLFHVTHGCSCHGVISSKQISFQIVSSSFESFSCDTYLTSNFNIGIFRPPIV